MTRYKYHIDRLNAIVAQFKTEPEEAAKALDEEKLNLEADTNDSDKLFAAAVYNALATIRTSPEQEKPVGQLIEAISDAVDELVIIMEYAEENA